MRPLHKKIKNIVHTLGLILLITAIAEANLNPVNVLADFLDQILTLIVVGINKLFSWLCETAVKALSKIVPALGGVLGAILGAAIGHLLDAYFEKRKSSIVTEFSAKVSFRTFKIHDYFLTFIGCLA